MNVQSEQMHKRIGRLRAYLAKNNIAGALLDTDAVLEYFTGLRREHRFLTRSRQNSQEYGCLLIGHDVVWLMQPALSALGYADTIGQYEAIDRLILYPDADLTGRTFARETANLLKRHARIGYTRDTSPVLVARLFEAGAVPVDISAAIDRLRAVKDETELAGMKRAAALCDRVYRDMLPHIKVGASCRDLAREIERLGEAYGATGPSFPAELLVHGPRAGPGFGAGCPTIEAGHTVAYDYGFLLDGYCSDFGRTIFLEPPEPRLARLYERLVAAQQAGIACMVAGKVTGQDVNRAARAVLAEAGLDAYFIHRLGHGIGRDVHERPFLAEGEDTVLEAGMCFTVEPSVYMPGQCLIRLEDVVVVTDTGGVLLNETTRDVVVRAGGGT